MDFILRYAPLDVNNVNYEIPSPIEDDTQDTAYELKGFLSINYVGNFIYDTSAFMQAGAQGEEISEISLNFDLIVYGFAYPISGGYLTILDRYTQGYTVKGKDLFSGEFAYPFVGIAVGAYVKSGATIKSQEGQVTELVADYLPVDDSSDDDSAAADDSLPA